MKSLVEDILASRDERGKVLDDVRKDTQHILSEAKKMLKDFAKEGGGRAEEVRKIAQEIKAFLKSSEENRKRDFGVTMDDIQDALKDVKSDSDKARKSAKDMVSRYQHSRMTAKKHWASLSTPHSKVKKSKKEESEEEKSEE